MDLKIGALSKKQSELYRPFLVEAAATQLQDENVRVVGAFDGKTLVGVMAFRVGNPAKILSIAVTPSYQRQGVGSALAESLTDKLSGIGVMGMEAFLFGTENDDVFKGLSAFLWRCGFSENESFEDYEPTLGEVAENKEFVHLKDKKRFKDIRFLSELTEPEKRNLGNALASEAEYTDFPREGLVDSLSTVYEKDGKPCGCVLMGKTQDQLMLHFTFLSNRAEDKTALIKMFAQTLNACREQYGDETKVGILATEEKGEKLAEFFFAGSKGATRLHRFIFSFSKEKEAERETAAEFSDDKSVTKGERPLGTDPVFEPLTNNDIQCKDCIYRIPNYKVSVCHKFDHKPDDVFGHMVCPKYRPEVGE